MTKTVTACVLIIGNEILSGRTKDANLPYLAEKLNEVGVQVREARVVADVEAEIVSAVNEMRAKHDYVFTTGGIGPTHDDITSECVAKAFGVTTHRDPEAVALLQSLYANPEDLNEARLKMATVPIGAELVHNPVSKAPGFRMENVYTLAGIPRVMQAQFDGIRHQLIGGATVHSITVSAFVGEGTVAKELAEIQAEHPSVDIGSYPFAEKGRFGTSLVARGTDRAELAVIESKLSALLHSKR